MENLKIRVNSEAESREVQELLFQLGFTWCGNSKDIFDFDMPEYIVNWNNGYITVGDDFNQNRKKITLPELRDLVVLRRNEKKDRNVIDPEYDDANLYLDSKGDLFVFHLPTQTWKESDLNNDPEVLARLQPIEKNMKEYLDKKPDGSYELIVSNGGCIDRDWIEIPDGAEAFGYTGIVHTFYKDDFRSFFNENTDGQWDERSETVIGRKDPVILWQREQDEPFLTPETTLNDQYAEIEEVRQVEIYGTIKAEPDFNFGAAEASGGAKPRENSHYFIDVSDVNEVDFYEIAKRYNVADPAIQHILKKCLAIGNRGHKDLETDLKDILKTAKRALQINGFGE